MARHERAGRLGPAADRQLAIWPGVLLGAALAMPPSAPPVPAAPLNGEIRLASPDGRVVFTLQEREGRLFHALTRAGQPVIEPSPIVFLLDAVDLTMGTTGGRVTRYRVDETYPWRGVHATAVDRANGARIAFTHAASGTPFTIEVRAYDAGVAFRQLVPAGDRRSRTPDERTAFILPAGSTAWYHDFENHYESQYTRRQAEDMAAGEWVAPPVTVALPGGRGHAAITEGGLAGYSGMGLQATGQRGVEIRLGHAQPLNYPFKLRYGEDEGRRLAAPAAIDGAIATPWRIVLVGPDLDTLVNADLVHNVAAPASPALRAATWIKPGRAVWRYLDGGDNTFETIKEFSRLAGELGFEYNLLEGFWQKWPEAQLRDLVEYSRGRGVGIWLWKHSKELRTPEARRAFLALCNRVGAVGAKIDFFDHEHKEVVEVYATLLREAAAHRIMLNFHGANKPAGEARTWPNELTREAVYGFERSKTAAWAAHNTTLPFTRYLAGPADFTPVVFGDRRRETSWAHQVATAAIFTSPLLVYGGHPKSLLENPAVDLIKAIPATWTETRVLPQSAIGERAVFARRDGEAWFLAILNGPAPASIRVPLEFLGRGRYAGLLARDRADDPAAITMERVEVDAGRVLEIDLRAGGGFLGRFVPGVGSRLSPK